MGSGDFRAVCCALLAKSLGAATSNKGAHMKRGPMPVGEETASNESLAMAAVQLAADEIVEDKTPAAAEGAKPGKQRRTLKKGMTDLFDADALGEDGSSFNQEGKHGSKEKPPRLAALEC